MAGQRADYIPAPTILPPNSSLVVGRRHATLSTFVRGGGRYRLT